MSKEVCVFLADGFEEVEGLTVVDILRRAGASVTTVSVTEDYTIHGAHGIDVIADQVFSGMDCEEADMIVLPGGMPGTLSLAGHEGLGELLARFDEQNRYIAAICAAPSILGKYGMLEGKRATSHPSKEKELSGAEVVHEPVVTAGNIITSRGMGTAIDFSLELVRILFGETQAEEISEAIVHRPSAQK